MRYRGGGRIGGFDDGVPTKQSAIGCWKIGEACQWLHVDRWPKRRLLINDMPDHVDTTVGGYGEIKPSIINDYPYPVGLLWQYSNDSGNTWITVQEDANHDIDDGTGPGDEDDGSLTLSGQTRNTGPGSYPDSDQTGVIPTERASVNGGFPDDGRLYRLIAVCGLRVVRSDYWDVDTQSWKGRCQVWNDRVVVQFQNGPCLQGSQCFSALEEINVLSGSPFELFANAKALGQEHGEEYDIVYGWRTSPNGVDNWTFQSGEEENEITFIPPPTSDVTQTVKIQNIFYIQCVATFTYSDLEKGIIIPKTARPLVRGYSPSVKVTVDPSPTNLSGTPGNGRVTLFWTTPVAVSGDPVTDYRVEYKTPAASTWTTFNDGTSTVTSAVVTGLANGTGYIFRVAAVYNIDSVIYSANTGTITPSAT